MENCNNTSQNMLSFPSEADLIVQTHTLPRQILVEYIRINTKTKQQITITSEQERLGFFICLSGEDRLTLQDSKEVIYIRKGVCGAYYEPKGLLNKAIYCPDEPFRVLSISMPSKTLENTFSKGGDGLSQLFQKKKFPNRPYAFRFLPLQPLVNTAVSQIFSPPVNQDFFPAYLEGKILEITSLMLQSLCVDSGLDFSPSLNALETAKLFQVQALLEENFQNQLSPIEIAGQCGLSINRMNRGFKELFGRTIAQYLRDIRMEKARILLAAGDSTVTDVCFQVGYSNLSHFAKLYRNYFGHTPVKDRKRFFSVQ
ncbi:MAG: hypothetical protein CSA21_05275 [Deltaproteobacteria bacterium]|nr:MAG: hypothetical protein CSA21_05275 [Deltaproteobacteria bacterium]